MTPIDDLLHRLDATGPDGWEDEYARRPVAMTRDHAFDVVSSGRASATWFAFRFDAGPPGVPLPPHRAAVEAVLGGRGATPLDAYCVVFSTRPLPDEVPSDVVLAVLCNSAIAALRRGVTWLGAWLAARAGLAAIALGAPEHAWDFLDGLESRGRHHPHLDKLAIFAPLRGHPALERNSWIRLAILRLWGGLGVSVLPRLPFVPPVDGERESLPSTLDALAQVGADKVAALVESLARALDSSLTNRSMLREHPDEQAAVRPSYERLCADTRRVAAPWSDPRSLTPRDVDRAVASIDVPELTTGLLELAFTSRGLAPVETLLLALSLRRSLERTEYERPWQAAFTRQASDAIYVLRATTLFALRLTLLDELLAAPHPRSALAGLYFQRANTRQVLSKGDQNEMHLILADMRTAMEMARAVGDFGGYASVVAAWVMLLARPGGAAHQPDRVPFDDASQAIDEALGLPLEPFDHALLHQARAHLTRTRDPLEAVRAFEVALSFVSPEDAFWSELAAELVETLTLAGRADEAAVRGHDFLARTSCDTDRIELGMLHLATGAALLSADRAPEARETLETGLRLVRGVDAHNEALAHFHLARLGMMTGDRTLTGEHLRFLRDRREDLDDQLRRDFYSVEAAAAGAAGHFDDQRAALQQAFSLARDAAARTRLRLELARVDLAANQTIGPLDDLIGRAMALSEDHALAAVLIDLVCNRDAPLSTGAREAMIEWARRGGRPSIAARLQHRAGRFGDARVTLRSALADALGDHERFACLHQLLTVLEPFEHEERRQACLELERRLDQHRDVPHVRMDLASGLLMDADGAPETLGRARQHVLRALEGVPDRRLVEQGHRLLGHIAIGSARAALPASSAATADSVGFLLGELSLPADEAARLRLAGAQILLLAGPIVHPQALERAQRLIARTLAKRTEDGHAIQLLARWKWIAQCIEAGVRVETDPTAIRGPLDAVPSWLIGLIHDRPTPLDPGEVGEDVPWVAPALQTRPDVADRVLGALLLFQHRLAPEPRRDLLEAIDMVIQSSPWQDGPAWTALRNALATVRPERWRPTLGLIESAGRRRSQRRSGDGTAVAPDEDLEADGEEGDLERARHCFERGVALMQGVSSAPTAQGAGQRIHESRELLGEAVRVGRERRMPEVVDFLISQGNAWRTPPSEDLERALHLYALASELDATAEQKAKLWKVEADALRERGRPGDLRRAASLLEQALGVRRGWLRAETLVSAARVALDDSDLGEGEREVRAASYLMDAVRVAPDYAAPTLVLFLQKLATWQRRCPVDPRPRQLRNELKTVYPERAAEIDRPVAVAEGRDVEAIVRVLEHPAWASFFEVRRRLVSPAERDGDSLGLMEHLAPSERAALEEQAKQESLFGDPAACRAALDALPEAPVGAARPGILAARVLLLAHRARLADGAADEVRAATGEVRSALDQVDDLLVRATLLREVAAVWSPDDHCDDPVRDFALAADLLRQCVAMEGGEVHACDDTLIFLARALRYSPAGDLAANLRESRRVYGLCLERARVSGGGDSIAGLLQNLGEVEGQMGLGTRQHRLRHNVERLREAVTVAQSPRKKSQCRANLAWELTLLGMEVEGLEGQRQLQEALTTFDRVDPAHVDGSARRYLAGNRTVCEASLARRSIGRDAEIEVWRRHLASLDPDAVPYLVAAAKHNLAGVLLTGRDIRSQDFAEGLRLLQEAAAVRTIARNPRHHWETALTTARALLDALRAGPILRPPRSPRDIVEEAREWLQGAITAARILGPGEELTLAAFGLCELGLSASSTDEMIEHTEGAWAVVREAAPYLLLHSESREREARIALHCAAVLAVRIAVRAPSIALPGLAFVLREERAETVVRWLLRGQEPARRPLRARLSRPRAVSAGVWESWLSALHGRDGRRVADALDRVRADAPEFLSGALDLEPTWTWLRAHPGSVAIATVLAEPVSLALVLRIDGAGHRRTWVLGLQLPPPPLPLEALPNLMRGAASGIDEGGAQESVAAWLRAHLVAPVEDFLGVPPSAVLWSPGPGLRFIAPGAIWRHVPVATTTTLMLPDLTTSPGRRRSTLVVLADPGPQASEPQLDLRGQGVPALEALSRAAAASGPVRILGSVGGCSGPALLLGSANVRDTPASASDVLAEAGEHQVIVLIAHGEVESLEEAAILCVDGRGCIDRLDVTRIGRKPDRFAGATVLLLSCEGGRVGDALAEPGGIAGTVISAGARCVVAPLWPVRLDVAVQVGEAVLRGIAEGASPWEVLAKRQIVGAEGSPRLGGPPPSLSERQAAHDLQSLAFVTWVG